MPLDPAQPAHPAAPASALASAPAQAPTTSTLQAPPQWQVVDFISDLHLEAGEAATFDGWRRYLSDSPADAIFILGDLFEVWVGDDTARSPGFEADCAALLHAAARQRPLFFMHGNRDFLLGADFARRSGMQLLDDPTVLDWQSRRWLLSHGDLLCIEDIDYLAFRAQVRTDAWQQAFLAQPLEQRRAVARNIRTQSEARKTDPHVVWADVDDNAARDWLRASGAATLIHGHTHRPADHDLGDGLRRLVLSDWHADATPPRAEVLRVAGSTGDWRRIPLTS